MEQEQWRAALSGVFVRLFDFFFFRPLVLIYRVDLPVPAGLEKKMSANLQIFEAINNSTRIWRRNARLWKHTNEGMKRSEKRREIRGSERCPFRGCKIWRSVDHWGSCSAWGNRWREDTLPRSLHWRGRWGTAALWEEECAPRMLLSSISVSHACIDTSRALRSRGKLLLTGPCKLSQPFRKTYTHTFVTGIYCTRYMIWKINISWTWHPSCTKLRLKNHS